VSACSKVKRKTEDSEERTEETIGRSAVASQQPAEVPGFLLVARQMSLVWEV
jgi:hypothetical protein